MANVFSDGFESNDFSAWDNDSSGAIAVSSLLAKEGTYSARLNRTTATTGFARKAIYGSNQNIVNYARIYLYISTLPSANIQVLRFSNASNQSQGHLLLLTTGVLRLVSQSGATIGNSSALSTGQWYCVELKIDATTNPGALEARVDGSAFASGSNAVQGSFARLLIGAVTPNSTGLHYIDSVVVSDSAYPGVLSSTGIKTINGLAKASVKTVNGLAIASVKTVNGLA